MPNYQIYKHAYKYGRRKNKITKRNLEVIELLAKGLSSKQIGEKLFITEKSVRSQLTFIYKKLKVKNRAELMALFIQQINLEDLVKARLQALKSLETLPTGR